MEKKNDALRRPAGDDRARVVASGDGGATAATVAWRRALKIGGEGSLRRRRRGQHPKWRRRRRWKRTPSPPTQKIPRE